MTKRTEPNTQSTVVGTDGNGAKSHRALVADIIIANAPDPVFVSDLEGKILQANDPVSLLLGFRQHEVMEQSLSRIITAKETVEFPAALREVVERGVTRNARLTPRSASCVLITPRPPRSALLAPTAHLRAAIVGPGDNRDMSQPRLFAESFITNAPDPVFVSDL